MRRFGVGLVLAGALFEPRAHADGPAVASVEPPWVWATESASPRAQNPAALSDHEADLQRICGRGDAGLRAVAKRLAERKLLGLPYLDADGLAQAQRVAGEPHVWPRAWVVSGLALDHESAKQKLAAWGTTFHEPGERRCGLAISFAEDGTEVVAAVALDATADLSPVPVRAHVGAWVTVDARALVPITGARVVVTGPSGPPRTLAARVDGDHVYARFAFEAAGAFMVQVVGDLANGPRPLLEAAVFVDTSPWTQPPDPTAPGESAAAPPDADDRTALLAMIAALRTSQQLRPFTPDHRLDALAVAHAERMKRQRSIAHDVGDGDPVQRFAAAGLRPGECGENVAHAASVALAHRALYASPSHRANLLSPAFDRIGIGVVRDPDGSVWVTEELAGDRH